MMTGFVSVEARSGPSQSTVYKGTLRDTSDGGVCVLLDDDCGLTRGVEVNLAVGDASMRAWVCHNTPAGKNAWHLGMSFAVVQGETPEQQLSHGQIGADSGVDDKNYDLHHLLADDNVSLQIWQEADAEQAFELVRDSRSDLEQWVEWAPQVRTSDNLREFIRYSLQQYQQGQTWQFAIRHKYTIVGGAGLIARPERVGEIGYWLGSAHQGQGIATLCARRVVRFGFETLGLRSIELRCAATNQRSRAVARRLGFLFETVIPRAQWTCRGMEDLLVYRSPVGLVHNAENERRFSEPDIPTPQHTSTPSASS